MSRVNLILGILVFSITSFSQASLQKGQVDKGAGTSGEVLKGDSPKQVSCKKLIASLGAHQIQKEGRIANVLYQDAFSASFNGDWSKAQSASACAAKVHTGSKQWKIDARKLVP